MPGALRCLRRGMKAAMSDHLASLFGTAVGMLPTSPARALELFTEITNYDETACDAGSGGSGAVTVSG